MDAKDKFLSKAAVSEPSLQQEQWAKVAHTLVAADWIVDFQDHDSGPEVIAFDPSTRIGLSITLKNNQLSTGGYINVAAQFSFSVWVGLFQCSRWG